MGFLSHRGPGVTAGFLNTLEKLSGAIRPEDVRGTLEKLARDPRKMNPMWGAAGLAAGLGVGARAQAIHGPKAFWPMTILGAMAAIGAAKLLQRYEQGGLSQEEQVALEMMDRARQIEAARIAGVGGGMR